MTTQSLIDMANGSIKERVDYEMTNIMANILDVNTDPTKKRELTLKISFTPNVERNDIKINTTASFKPVPTNPVTFSLFVGTDGNGELIVAEMTPQIPGQRDVYGGEQEEAPLLRLVK